MYWGVLGERFEIFSVSRLSWQCVPVTGEMIVKKLFLIQFKVYKLLIGCWINGSRYFRSVGWADIMGLWRMRWGVSEGVVHTEWPVGPGWGHPDPHQETLPNRNSPDSLGCASSLPPVRGHPRSPRCPPTGDKPLLSPPGYPKRYHQVPPVWPL